MPPRLVPPELLDEVEPPELPDEAVPLELPLPERPPVELTPPLLLPFEDPLLAEALVPEPLLVLPPVAEPLEPPALERPPVELPLLPLALLLALPLLLAVEDTLVEALVPEPVEPGTLLDA